MSSTQLSKLGLGSSFNQMDHSELKGFEVSEHIKDYQLFYTGRHAIRNLLDTLQKEKPIETIWLPAYYCQHVTAWLNAIYDNIKSYTMNPFDCSAPMDIESFATENDIVILNNFWGMYSYMIPTHKDRPIYIEDHSHGWLSDGCLHSTADYCFASLRKTLPIPIGGISWSTKKTRIVADGSVLEQKNLEGIWNEIAAAMEMKTKILNGAATIKKQTYLELIEKTENALNHQFEVVQLKKDHRATLEAFLHKDYDFYKRKNLSYIVPKIKPSATFALITHTPEATFGLPILFENREDFTSFKNFLIKHDIYPSELWPDNQLHQKYKYLLNIHIDFRYDHSDMDYIANTINKFSTHI